MKVQDNKKPKKVAPKEKPVLFQAIPENYNLSEFILERDAFLAAVYSIVKGEHYPGFHFMTDDTVNPKHVGGNIYEGAKVDSRMIDCVAHELNLGLVSPSHQSINVKNMRWMSAGRTRYWNAAHPMMETFHGKRRGLSEPTPEWLQKALRELPNDLRIPAAEVPKPELG